MQIGIQQWCIARFVGDQFVQWNDWEDCPSVSADTATTGQRIELGYAQASAARSEQDQDWAVYTRILTPSAPVKVVA
jgi:hypothetical protein